MEASMYFSSSVFLSKLDFDKAAILSIFEF